MRYPELNVPAEYAACTLNPDAESDPPSSLLQVRDVVIAASVAGMGLAAMGLIGVMFSRNKRQKQ